MHPKGVEPIFVLIGSQMPYQLGDIRIFELLPRIELSLFLITSEVHHHSCVRSVIRACGRIRTYDSKLSLILAYKASPIGRYGTQA